MLGDRRRVDPDVELVVDLLRAAERVVHQQPAQPLDGGAVDLAPDRFQLAPELLVLGGALLYEQEGDELVQPVRRHAREDVVPDRVGA